MKKKLRVLLVPVALLLLLTGCLFRPADDLYKPPEVPAEYDRLKAAIREVQIGLEMEFGTSTDVAVILSGDNTATIQLQDLNGDGERESAVTFLKVPGVEKSLKIYIFAEKGEEYEVTGVVEGDGAAIYSVAYVDLNGTGSKELVVCWQISTGVYQLGAYTLDELRPSGRKEPANAILAMTASEREGLLATQLLLTGCGVASNGTSVSSGFRLLDLDQDTRTEIALARMDPGGVGSQIEVYGWLEGAFQKVDSVPLSPGSTTLNRIGANYLKGELSPPALYVTTTIPDGSRVIDVVAYQSVKDQEDKALVNLSMDPDTGTSVESLRGYTDILPMDINDDYVAEVPAPMLLPTYGEGTSVNFWLIDWWQYDEEGDRDYVMTTYHNVQDSWYLEIPEKWRDSVILARNDQISGQREVVFSMWQGDDKAPQPFLSIYRLTGNNRSYVATAGNRFILREEENVIYAAKFYDSKWDCGLDETDLIRSFKTIQTAWYTD